MQPVAWLAVTFSREFDDDGGIFMKLMARVAGSLGLAVLLAASTAASAAPTTSQHSKAVLQSAAINKSGCAQYPLAASTVASPLKAIDWGNTRLVIGGVARNIVSFDNAIREHVNIRMVFMNWGATYFNAGEIRRNAAAGAQSVIELMPRNKNLIQLGNPGYNGYNKWICSFLGGNIARLGIPVTISFGSEMNGPWYSWGAGQFKPQVFIRAWRHVHELLAGSKAGPLITWMWQPSAIHFHTASPVPWFPGSKYVNIIGLDGYFVLPSDNFDVIFKKTIQQMRQITNVPIMVGETAIGWYTGHAILDMQRLFQGIRRYHLKGMTWFNINQKSTSIYHEDWRIQDRSWLQHSLTRQITWTERLRSVP